MSWVKLDDQFTDHPKLISVGPLGVALQVAALCYSNAHLTDGFIQFNAVRKLLCWEFSPPGSDVVYSIGITSGMSGEDVTWDMVAGWLVDAGIWEQVEGGYQIHDYDDYQQSKDQVLTERSKAQTRMKKLRSPEVHPNNNRTSSEVTPKFNDPVPVPLKESTTRGGGANISIVPNSYIIYEQEMGALTPAIADDIKAAEIDYPEEWIIAAIRESARANKRNWKYALAILRRWKVEGFQSVHKPPPRNSPPNRVVSIPEEDPIARAKIDAAFKDLPL